MSDKPRSSEALPLRREHDTDTPSGPDQNMQGISMSDREMAERNLERALMALRLAVAKSIGAYLQGIEHTALAAARADERAKVIEECARIVERNRMSAWGYVRAIRALSTPEAKET